MTFPLERQLKSNKVDVLMTMRLWLWPLASHNYESDLGDYLSNKDRGLVVSNIIITLIGV